MGVPNLIVHVRVLIDYGFDAGLRAMLVGASSLGMAFSSISVVDCGPMQEVRWSLTSLCAFWCCWWSVRRIGEQDGGVFWTLTAEMHTSCHTPAVNESGCLLPVRSFVLLHPSC